MSWKWSNQHTCRFIIEAIISGSETKYEITDKVNANHADEYNILEYRHTEHIIGLHRKYPKFLHPTLDILHVPKGPPISGRNRYIVVPYELRLDEVLLTEDFLKISGGLSSSFATTSTMLITDQRAVEWLLNYYTNIRPDAGLKFVFGQMVPVIDTAAKNLRAAADYFSI